MTIDIAEIKGWFLEALAPVKKVVAIKLVVCTSFDEVFVKDQLYIHLVKLSGGIFGVAGYLA